MGWTYVPGYTKAQLLEELLGRNPNPNDYAVHRNIVWAIIEDLEPRIACYLLDQHPQHGWGYRDLYEIEGPCYYDCPLSLLERVPVASRTWREKVRAFHESPQRRSIVTAK